MRAMVLREARTPLVPAELPMPEPGAQQIVVRVAACGICRTDLHIVDGELRDAKRPLVLGHQIVGTIVARGTAVDGVRDGDRVGVPWLGGSDGTCRYCVSGRENLCDRAVLTGYHVDGGYAAYCVADAAHAVPVPRSYADAEATPLLCAGAIGWRALAMTGDAERLGFYGFGNSARLLVQVARAQGRRVFAFTRPGDAAVQRDARELGSVWAGGSDETPPEPLDAAILFAPDGALVPVALGALAKGGVLVCAEIHMSDLPSFPYALLWGERVVRSVANLTHRDARELLAFAARTRVRTTVTCFPLDRANQAIAAVRAGLAGTAVLVP